jgi:predicted HicB family RNase H-like nuclease
MSRVSKGKRRLTCDIPEDLHKELRFLAVEHDTSITKYVKALLEEHVKKVRKEK